MGFVWSTQVKMPIVSMLASEGFGKHEFEIHFVSPLAMDGFG